MPGQDQTLLSGSHCTQANAFVVLQDANMAGRCVHQSHLHLFLTKPPTSNWTLWILGQSQIIIKKPRNYERVDLVHGFLFVLQLMIVGRHQKIYTVMGLTNLDLHTNQRIKWLIFVVDGYAVAEVIAIHELEVCCWHAIYHVTCFVDVVSPWLVMSGFVSVEYKHPNDRHLCLLPTCQKRRLGARHVGDILLSWPFFAGKVVSGETVADTVSYTHIGMSTSNSRYSR